MQGITHKLGGVAAGAALALVMPPESATEVAIIVGASIVGSLLPDIDHPNSTISHKLRITGKVVSSLVDHRTLFHYASFYLCICLALSFVVPMPIISGIFVGVLSHLVLDTLNPTGIPWLAPFTSKKFHILGIKTGGIGEWVTRIALVLIIVFEVYTLLKVA